MQLLVDGGEPLGDVLRLSLDDVHEEASPLEVCQELVAEADSLMGALEQAGHVGDRELPSIRALDRAQDRCDRGERILGDLGLGVRDQPQQRGFARVGEADERRVREELEAELNRGLVAADPHLGQSRSLVCGRGEAPVARAACTPVRHRGPPARVREVDEEPAFGVEHLRPHGHAKLDGFSASPVFVAPLAVAAAAACEAALALEERKVAKIGIGDEDDIAAVAAVAAVGAAPGHVLLTPEAERAVAAAAPTHLDAGPVVEHKSPRGWR